VSGQFIYWSNWAAGTIGRARVNGTQVNQRFITGAFGPLGITVHGKYLYWSNWGSDPGTGHSIGRALLDGKSVQQRFITGAAAPAGITIATVK
jgi:virginiamycin B lyase